MACARSSAHRSATSATTTMAEGSRRVSVQTVQGFCVSMLPQILHTSILSIAVCKAAASGAISSSRFLMRNNAARRAERGPSPGRRASSWIRRSISGPAATVGMIIVPLPLVGGIMHLTYHDSKPYASEVSTAKAEEAGAPEIEITPEMIAVGEDVLLSELGGAV